MRIFLLSLLHIGLFTAAFGQSNNGVVWQRSLGGTSADYPSFTQKTNDGGILVLGYSNSQDGDAVSSHGSGDIFIVKLTTDGVVLWKRCYGGPGPDRFNGFYYDPADGSTVVAGNATVAGGDVPVVNGYQDAWAFKIDANGNLLWTKCYGGSLHDIFTRVTKAANGDYIFLGTTSSNDGNVSGNHGLNDVWVCRTNAAGTLLWNKCYGGSQQDNAVTSGMPGIIETADGNFIIHGQTGSNDGDMGGNHGANDLCILKISGINGGIIWNKLLGGNNDEKLADIRQTNSGEIYVYGTSVSSDLPNYHPGTIPGSPPYDLYLAKLTSSGALLWQKCYGSSLNEFAYQAELTDAGGVEMLSTTMGNGGDVSGFHGRDDIWVIKVRSDGNIEWQRALGGSGPDDVEAINILVPFDGIGSFTRQPDGSMLISGFSSSGDGDVTGVHDTTSFATYGFLFYGDLWVTKLSKDGVLQWQQSLGGHNLDASGGQIIALSDSEYIATGVVASRDGNINGGHNNSFVATDMWVCRVGPVSTIKGNVYLDYNGNQVHDTGEPFFPNAMVQSSKPGFSKASVSTYGSFVNEVDTGHYTTVCIPFKNYYNIFPASHLSNFPAYGLTDSFDFALKPIPGYRDLQLEAFAAAGAGLGTATAIRLLYFNAGTEMIPAGELKFVKDSRTSYLNATPPWNNVSGDTVKWSFSNLQPMDSGSVLIRLRTATPPVLNINDTLHHYSRIEPVANDSYPADNESYLNQLVRAGFDPNDKTERRAGFIAKEAVDNGEYLQYLIRFQNTGNDTAFNIVIRDTLDSRLDWSSFEVLSASHPYFVNQKGGQYCNWTFNNIKLPDSGRNEPASHGYVLYQVKPKANLVAGDTIRNRASIYFDANLPIQTNIQTTVVRNLTLVNPPVNDEFYVVDIFPQPAREQINIGFKRNVSGHLLVRILDMKGSLVQEEDKGYVSTNGLSVPVIVNRLPKGTYFLFVTVGSRTVQTKFIIQ